jgi:hypothetical protein
VHTLDGGGGAWAVLEAMIEPHFFGIGCPGLCLTSEGKAKAQPGTEEGLATTAPTWILQR